MPKQENLVDLQNRRLLVTGASFVLETRSQDLRFVCEVNFVALYSLWRSIVGGDGEHGEH